jgi:hypothetical protein
MAFSNRHFFLLSLFLFFTGPFSTQPPTGAGIPSPSPPSGDDPRRRRQLQMEEWFHGPISRREAEGRLMQVRINHRAVQCMQCSGWNFSSRTLMKLTVYISLIFSGWGLSGARIPGQSRTVRAHRDAEQLQKAPASRRPRGSGECRGHSSYGCPPKK